MKQQPQIQASGASETTRFFCTRISSAAGAAGELCTTQRKEPDMAKRENEGKKEKKQKKERKEKRKQYRGLLLNPISVPRARTRAYEGRRLACTCTFAEAGEAGPWEQMRRSCPCLPEPQELEEFRDSRTHFSTRAKKS